MSILDFAHIDLQALPVHQFTQKQKEKYFTVQGHLLMEQPIPNAQLTIAFRRQQEMNIQQQRLQLQNNELLAFKAAASHDFSQKKMPDLIRMALQEDSLLAALGVEAQGDFNFYSEVRGVSEARALQGAGIAAVMGELQLSKEIIDEVNDAIAQYRRALAARWEAKQEIKQLKDFCARTTKDVENTFHVLLLHQRRIRLQAVKRVLERLARMQQLVDDYEKLYFKGSESLRALHLVGEEFDSLAAEFDEYQQVPHVLELMERKKRIALEAQQLSTDEFLNMFLQHATSQCALLRFQVVQNSPLAFEFDLADYLNHRFAQIQPTDSLYAKITSGLLPVLSDAVQQFGKITQQFVFASGALLYLQQLMERVAFPSSGIYLVLRGLKTSLKSVFIEQNRISGARETLAQISTALETQFGREFEPGEIRFLYVKLLQSLTREIEKDNPGLLLDQGAANDVVLAESFQRMSATDPVGERKMVGLKLIQINGVLCATLDGVQEARPYAVSSTCVKIAAALLARKAILHEIDVPAEYTSQLRSLVLDHRILSVYFSHVQKMMSSDQLREATALENLHFLILCAQEAGVSPAVVKGFQAALGQLQPQLIKNVLEKFEYIATEQAKEFTRLLDLQAVSSEEQISKELIQQLIAPLARIQAAGSDAMKFFGDKLGHADSEELHAAMERIGLNSISLAALEFNSGIHRFKKTKKATPAQRCFLLAFSIRKFAEFILAQGADFGVEFKPNLFRQQVIDEMVATLGNEAYVQGLPPAQSAQTPKSVSTGLSVVKGLFASEQPAAGKKPHAEQ